MIDLHYWTTPNGDKIVIALEELGLPYRIVPVNISAGEQFKPDFLRISPNNRMPAIVDNEPDDAEGPLSIFESGAILEYLADKTGRLLPHRKRERFERGALKIPAIYPFREFPASSGLISYGYEPRRRLSAGRHLRRPHS
jgi:glutathione S-transferase